MAWNEPGGNRNDNDPWGGGNRGGNQGPPDLDEALKKGMEKLNKLFGGKGGGSTGSASGSGGTGGAVAIVVIALLVFLAFDAVYTVQEAERAVVQRFGKYHDTTTPGLRFKLPLIDKVTKVDVSQVRSSSTSGNMLTEDESIVDVTLNVQYVVADPRAFILDIRNAEATLAYATDSALRHEVGSAEFSQVITEGRTVLVVRIEERLQRFLDFYNTGLQISKVTLEDSRAPTAVKDAFDDVQRAKEDEQRFKEEAQAYKNKVVPEARGRAQRILEEANAYREEVIARAEGETSRFLQLLSVYQRAPDVTRERLYIDTLQKVMNSSSKVLVDVEGGNNMMYLPLDRIGAGVSSGPVSDTGSRSPSSTSMNRSEIQSIADQVIDELRARQSSTTRRGRE